MENCHFKTLIAFVWVMSSIGRDARFTHATNLNDHTLWFTSNPTEFENYDVTLERPLPSWIKGIYIKNGCGLFELGHTSFVGALDGFAKLHSLTFSGSNSVRFTAKFLRSNFYNASQEQGKIAPYLTLAGIEPPLGVMEKGLALARGTDNTNVIVFEFGASNTSKGQTVCLSDYWAMYEIDDRNLATKRRIDASVPEERLWENWITIPACSHAVKEPHKNTYINLYSSLSPLLSMYRSINVIRIHSATSRSLIARIPRDTIPYMHSFGMTPRYAVVFAHPVIVNVIRLLSTARPLECLSWNPNLPLDIYVVDLQTGQVRHLTSSAAFVMHYVNGFDDVDGSIVTVDMITYPDDEIIKSMSLDSLRRGALPSAKPSITRYIINLDTNSVVVEHFNTGIISASHVDLTAINPSFAFRPYCFIYGISNYWNNDSLTGNQTVLAKKNICGSPNRDKIWFQAHTVPSEPHFFPRPNATIEDDGILMSLVLDSARNTSFVLFLDARTMRKKNSGYLPTWVPFSFHGKFFTHTAL